MRDQRELRAIYADIIAGHTKATILGRTAYLRHVTPVTQGRLDAEFLSSMEAVKKRGIHTEKERLEQLELQGLWGKAKEDELATATEYVSALEKTKASQVLPSQVEQLNAQLKEARNKLSVLIMERNSLIGGTAEQFATKQVNDTHIIDNLFEDSEYKTLFFSKESFDALEQHEFDAASIELQRKLRVIDESSIKHIAISSFLQNALSLTGEHIIDFFGLPAVKLTSFQLDLLIYGRFFRNILADSSKIPLDVVGDPDKLIDWHRASENAGELMKKTSSASVSLVGATKEDLKKIAGKDDTILSIGEATEGKEKMRGPAFMKILMG